MAEGCNNFRSIYAERGDVSFIKIYIEGGLKWQIKKVPPDRILRMFRESREAESAQKDGMLLDISGGGAKFIGRDRLEVDSYILMIVRLTSSSMDKQYFIKGHVLASEEAENRWGKVETRVQFIFHDNRMQEEIIRYIFEEERKIRKKS